MTEVKREFYNDKGLLRNEKGEPIFCEIKDEYFKLLPAKLVNSEYVSSLETKLAELESMNEVLEQCCDEFNKEKLYLVTCEDCKKQVSANMCIAHDCSKHVNYGGDIQEIDVVEHECFQCHYKNNVLPVLKRRQASDEACGRHFDEDLGELIKDLEGQL